MCIHTVVYILHTLKRNSLCTLEVQPLTYVHAYCILKHVNMCSWELTKSSSRTAHTSQAVFKKKKKRCRSHDIDEPAPSQNRWHISPWHWWACFLLMQVAHLTVTLVSLLLPTSACCSAAQERPNLLSGISVAKFHTVNSSALNSVRVTELCNSLCENSPNSLQPSVAPSLSPLRRCC